MYRTLREEWRFSKMQFTDTPFGYRFAGTADMIAGTFEAEERLLLQRYLADADVFVDIGANVGYFTCLACSMGKRVIAVEPLSSNLRYLYENLQANGWNNGVEIYPVGLADKPGLGFLYGGGTGASLVAGWAGAAEAFRRTVPLSTLDILLGDRFEGKRLVIKMDVEGAEYAALLGGSRLMRTVPPPVWLVEITLSDHRQDTRNLQFADTFELFWALGYTATPAGRENRKVGRSEVRQYAETAVKPDWAVGNYLFTEACR